MSAATNDPSEPLPPGIDIGELVAHLPATVFVMTNEFEASVLYISDHIERLTGYSAEEWMSDRHLWISSTHPEDRQLVEESWATSIRDGSPFDCEYRVVRRDGSVIWARESTVPARDDDGTVTSWHGIVYDITDRRIAEEALTRSEARYRALVERLPAVVYVDSDESEPRSLYVSPSSEDLFGHRPGDYLADDTLWMATILEDDRPRVKAAWHETVERRVPFLSEYRIVRPDGSTVWVRDSSIPVTDGRHHRPAGSRRGAQAVGDPLPRAGRATSGRRLRDGA
jgi:PAS domain S-box-containing protein